MTDVESRRMQIRKRRRRQRRMYILLVEFFVVVILLIMILIVTFLWKDSDVPLETSQTATERPAEMSTAVPTGETDASTGESFARTESTGESTEESTEETTEADPMYASIYEDTGIWVLDSEYGKLFDTEDEYLRKLVLKSRETFKVHICNLEEEDRKVELLLDNGGDEELITFGGDVPADGQMKDFRIRIDQGGEFMVSYLCTGAGRVDAYVASPNALRVVLERMEAGKKDNTFGNYEWNIHMNGAPEDYPEEMDALPYETKLWWKRNAPAAEEIAEAANIGTYNGEDMRTLTQLGGETGAKVTFAKLIRDENPALSEELSLTVLGNNIEARIPYGVPEECLYSMRVAFGCEEASKIELSGEGANPDGTVNLRKETFATVTDAEGRTRVYRLTGDRLKHNVPVIYINTEGGRSIDSKYVYQNATFAMDSNGNERFSDVETATIRIRGRGHSTWLRWPKKSYKMNFDEKVALMGDEKDSDWLLVSNYYDRSLTRNYLASELAKTLDHLEYTPDIHPVDVFMNGQYFGTYDLCEQIEVADGRLEMKTDPASADSGFMIEVGGNGEMASFSAGLLTNVEIHYPGKDITDAQYNYIVDYVRRVDTAIRSGENIEELVDVDSLIDWILLEEFCYNWDAGFLRNVYMYKEPGGKLKFGPVWDFDLSMGSVGYITPDEDYGNSWALSMNGLTGETWVTHVLDNPSLRERMKVRWLEVREPLMETMKSTLDEMEPVLSPSYEENYWRWMTDVENQNIAWEWPMEYENRHLPGLYTYLRSIFDYRYDFLNRSLIDGYQCPRRPKKDDTVQGYSNPNVGDEKENDDGQQKDNVEGDKKDDGN